MGYVYTLARIGPAGYPPLRPRTVLYLPPESPGCRRVTLICRCFIGIVHSTAIFNTPRFGPSTGSSAVDTAVNYFPLWRRDAVGVTCWGQEACYNVGALQYCLCNHCMYFCLREQLPSPRSYPISTTVSSVSHINHCTVCFAKNTRP